MSTFDDVYNRIITDLNLNKHKFTIEYKNFDRTLEMLATKWIPIKKGGEIPTHKVVNIKFNGKIIWNKEKLCLIDECVENIDESKNILQDNFTITTFNVLSDEYEKNITNLSKRLKDILDFVTNDHYDIICLQEVQSILLNELKKLEGYYICNTNIGINDIAIVTKIEPVSFELVDMGHQKNALLVTLKLENEKYLNIVGVHLTSDYHDDSSKKRISQLYKIKSKLIGMENVILLGDINEPVYEHNLMHFNDYIDCWINLKSEKGFTYNPTTNALAKKLSISRAPLRLDRILYNRGNLVCENVSILNDVVFSDHYPVIANFKIDYDFKINDNIQNNNINLTNQTALCIIPPYDTWNYINKLKIGEKESKWMNHLNLFFGFVHSDQFYSIYKDVLKLNLQPFNVTFDKLSYFSHEKTFTLYLKPNEESYNKLVNLYNVLKTVFNDNKMTFTPHITLGNTINESKVNTACKQQVNLTFNVDIISFVSRIGYEYFRVLRNVVLGKLSMDIYINFVKNVCSQLNVDCKLCGSRIFELSNNSSDADILCIGVLTRDDFFTKLTKLAETCGYFKSVVIAKNKYVYCLKLKTNDSNIDIQYANLNDTNDIYYKTSMAMYNEPKFIIDTFTSLNKMDLFRECLEWTKNKLKEKNIYGGIFCFMSGISASILVSYIVKQRDVKTLQEFIIKMTEVNYDKPISLSGNNSYNSNNPCDRHLYIGTSTPPIENTMRHICRSTAYLLKNQFKTGFTFDNDNIFSKIIIFKIDALDDNSLNECIEWFNGMVATIIVAIERNSKDITLCPSTKWHIADLEATWILKSSHDYASLNYVADKMVNKSKELFTKAFLSYF